MLYISPCCWRRISPLSAAVTSLALNGVRRSPSGCGIQLVFGPSWGLYAVSDCIRVVKGAHLAMVLASDWFSWLLTGSATADRGLLRGSRAQPEMTSPGSHVV